MKLTRTLEISEDEFYDHLEQEILADIKKNMPFFIVNVKDIKKGLNYTKIQETANSRTEITIEEYIRSSFYKATIKTISDTVTISYKTHPVEKGLEVVFEQFIESFEKSNPNRFMKLFSEAVYFGRMSDTLFDIQNSIVRSRLTQE